MTKGPMNIDNLLLNLNTKFNNESIEENWWVINKKRKFVQEIKKQSLDEFAIHINYDYTRLRVDNFKGFENHYLELAINNNCNLHFIDYSFPEIGIEPNKIFKFCDTIESHIKTFLRYLEQLNEFYNNLSTIDELCFVVEPFDITTKAKTRTFKFNERIYIKIIIDPLSPSSIVINFLGPALEIEPLRQKYKEKISEWDIGLDIYKNLLRMFDLMYFPMKPNNHKETNEKNCNICFSLLLENQLPIITCDNQKCDVVFHMDCLKRWFSTLEQSKTFLKIIMGRCPYCKEKLSTALTPI